MWEWDLTRTIAATSGALAFFSLLLSSVSLRVSILNRRLALSQEANKRPNLLFENVRSLQFSTEKSVIFALRLQATNGSDNTNSIFSAELLVHLPKTWNAPRLRIAADQSDSSDHANYGRALAIPAIIPAHGAIGGWLFFPVSRDFLDGKDLERFDLIVQDGKQSVHRLNDVIFLRDIA